MNNNENEKEENNKNVTVKSKVQSRKSQLKVNSIVKSTTLRDIFKITRKGATLNSFVENIVDSNKDKENLIAYLKDTSKRKENAIQIIVLLQKLNE